MNAPFPSRGVPPSMNSEGYASPPRRLLANVLDSLIIGMPLNLLLTPFGGGFARLAQSIQGIQQGIRYPYPYPFALLVVFTIIGFVVVVVYETLMLSRNGGQTLGKKICRIRVVSGSGQPVTMSRALRRTVVKGGISVLATLATPVMALAALMDFVTLVGWLSILGNDRRRAWHDRAADTVVFIDE